MKKRSHLGRYNWFDYLNILIFVALCLIMVLPFWTVLMTSLVGSNEYYATPFILWPREITFVSYRYIFSDAKLLTSLYTTIAMTVIGTVYSMLMTTTLAYGLTKKDLIGRNFLLVFIIIPMYFGGGLIPYYLLVRSVGLVNSFWVLVIPTAISIWNLMVIKAFFNQIPSSLEESAKIDGANDILIFVRIILPLSLPTLATFALFYGVEYWNKWYDALIFINNENLFPLQLVLRRLIIQNEKPVGMDQAFARMEAMSSSIHIFPDGVKMATVVVATAPILMAYPFLQKYFVKGITLGSVKG